MGRKRNKYPREFKLEAVRLMQKRECTIAELARRLSVQEHDLRDWEKQYAQKGDDAFPGQGRTSGAAAEIRTTKARARASQGRARHLKKGDGLLREGSRVRSCRSAREPLKPVCVIARLDPRLGLVNVLNKALITAPHLADTLDDEMIAR